MKIQLSYKIFGLAVASALIPAFVLSIILLVQERPMRTDINNELTELIGESLSRTAENVYASCQTANDLVQEQITDSINVAQYIQKTSGGLKEGKDVVEWDTVNQFTQQRRKQELPKMYLGGNWLGQNELFSSPTLLVDEVQGLVGGTVTIFQKMNDRGDMLRVATNVKDLEGNRAIGSYIPAYEADGNANEVVKTLMSGQTYKGTAYVVNDWYITAYEPLKNDAGEVIGALYVGVPQKKLKSLNRAIEEIQVGDNGYVWVLKGNGEDLRENIVLKTNNVDEKNIVTEETLGAYKEIREKAVKLGKNEIGTMELSWKGAGEDTESLKTVKYMYFAQWDWVIIVTGYNNDFSTAFTHVSDLFRNLKLGVLLAIFITLVVVGFLAFIIGSWIGTPITAITRMTSLVADGNIGAAVEMIEMIDEEKGFSSAAHRDDETGQMFRSVTTMIENLNALIGQVKGSSKQLLSTSGEIADLAKEQEASAEDFKVTSGQVAMAVQEISSTSQELTKTMTNVSETANVTREMADKGVNELHGMEQTMDQLSGATGSISSKLSVILEKAGNINSVVTTIAKVADQTNLLSLNAAIEAEKAGEYGVGFAVVAREIRRLADQSALATLDIEEMVKEMQTAVNSGVMEMDKFTDAVKGGVSEVGIVSERLEKIIMRVQELYPQFEAVKGGMESQTKGAQQINDAMTTFTDGAQNTIESIKRFEAAIELLRVAGNGLKNEVAHFTVLEKSSGDTFSPFEDEE